MGFGDDADNLRYDMRSGQLLLGYGNGGLGLVDATGQKVGTIPLSSHPESFQIEEGGSRIFVNVPKEFAVAVVDRTKDAVISKDSSFRREAATQICGTCPREPG
jgi:hypothetical protein